MADARAVRICRRYFCVRVPWGEVAFGTFVPAISFNADYLMIVVAVLGTTISPYLFFWQASQEVEEMHRGRRAGPLKQRAGGQREITRITRDTTIGMIFSNLVAYSIVLTTAVTLHAHGVTNIQTAADAANALRPIAGEFAFLLFAAGLSAPACSRSRCLPARRLTRSEIYLAGAQHWRLNFRRHLAST